MLQQQIRRLDRAATEDHARTLFQELGSSAPKIAILRNSPAACASACDRARARHDPSVILMDEPFGALDAITRTQIRHDLKMLWLDTRKTVLFITHSIEEAIGFDRVIVMSKAPGR